MRLIFEICFCLNIQLKSYFLCLKNIFKYAYMSKLVIKEKILCRLDNFISFPIDKLCKQILVRIETNGFLADFVKCDGHMDIYLCFE